MQALNTYICLALKVAHLSFFTRLDSCMNSYIIQSDTNSLAPLSNFDRSLCFAYTQNTENNRLTHTPTAGQHTLHTCTQKFLPKTHWRRPLPLITAPVTNATCRQAVCDSPESVAEQPWLH